MFLHPIMLAGTAAVAVPVLIHLLNRRRYVDVTWAAMRFLRAADNRNRRRLQHEDLLLLLLRCAAVALLAVAAAGPVLGRRAGVGRGSVTMVVVVDDSAAMTGTDGVANRFDRAKEAAADVLTGLPAGSAVAVLMASDAVAPLVPSPTRDLSLARRLIAGAPITDRSSDLLPAVRAAADVLRTVRGPKRVTVITGGQRAALARADDIAAVLRASPDVSARFVLVGPDVRANVGVAALRPAGDLTPVGPPLQFEATVANHGAEAVRDLPVRLSIDGAPPTAEATIGDLPPAESRVVPLYAKLPSPGPHAVTVSLPADRLPADDHRTVIVRGRDAVRVVLVADADAVGRNDSAAAFLRAALLPVPPDRRADYFVKVTTVTPTALASTRLDGMDAVVLAGPTPVDPPAADALAAYVHGGGGLIVFPTGPVTGPLARLLPAAVGPVHGDAAHPRSLAAGPFDHPIAALWNDRANGSPGNVHVFRSADLTPAADARVVLPFADGQPFAVERPMGSGRVVLFAVAADTAASDLPDRGGVFVPLLYRCLASIVNRGDESLNVAVGQPLLGPAAVTDVGRPVSIATPGGGHADATVTLAADGAGFRYDATDRAGPYAATVDGTTTLFAAGIDPAESKLDAVTAADRATLSAVATVGGGRATVAAAAAPASNGELSVPVLLGALVLAAAEPFVANVLSRPR